jgi:hypothetical protein
MARRDRGDLGSRGGGRHDSTVDQNETLSRTPPAAAEAAEAVDDTGARRARVSALDVTDTDWRELTPAADAADAAGTKPADITVASARWVDRESDSPQRGRSSWGRRALRFGAWLAAASAVGAAAIVFLFETPPCNGRLYQPADGDSKPCIAPSLFK